MKIMIYLALYQFVFNGRLNRTGKVVIKQ